MPFEDQSQAKGEFGGTDCLSLAWPGRHFEHPTVDRGSPELLRRTAKKQAIQAVAVRSSLANSDVSAMHLGVHRPAQGCPPLARGDGEPSQLGAKVRFLEETVAREFRRFRFSPVPPHKYRGTSWEKEGFVSRGIRAQIHHI